MALIATNEAEILLLQIIVNMVDNGDQVLHLYTNDVTPTDATLQAGLTESTEAGYAPITLVGSSWTTTQVGGLTTAEYPESTFSYTTAASVYGYYVTSTSDEIMWVERFSGAPFQLPDSGGDIAITCKLTLD